MGLQSLGAGPGAGAEPQRRFRHTGEAPEAEGAMSWLLSSPVPHGWKLLEASWQRSHTFSISSPSAPAKMEEKFPSFADYLPDSPPALPLLCALSQGTRAERSVTRDQVALCCVTRPGLSPRGIPERISMCFPLKTFRVCSFPKRTTHNPKW